MAATSGAGRASRVRGQILTLPRFLAISGLLTGMLAARPQVMDPDFWWHLRNGLTLIATNHLIHVNPYAFMSRGHHWVLQEWLSETWMAAAFSLAGRLGVVIGYELITLALLALIWLRARELGRPHGLTVGVGVLFAALVSYPIFGPRSQMESYMLTALILLICERQLRRGGQVAWVLPPIFLLWTNLHAGFILGLIFLAAICAVEVCLVSCGKRDRLQRSRIWQLCLASLCSVGASMINPNGHAILIYPFQTQFSTAQQRLIQEWHSPDFHDLLLVPLLLLILSFGYLLVRYRRISLRDAVILGLSLALTLQSVRQSVVLVAASMPVWIDLAEEARRELANRWRLHFTVPQPRPMLLLELLELLGLVAILTVQVFAGGSPSLDSSTYVNAFPVCAARWLDTAPAGLRIFNQYGDGGFLAYTVPKDKVFIFGDAALMGSPLLNRYAAIIDLSPQWLTSLDRSPSELVVFERGTAFPDALQQEPAWTLVYRDRRVEAFERTSLLKSIRLPQNPTAGYWRSHGVGACASQARPLPA